MPCISRFFGITIHIYRDDHSPPHFHARYGGQEAAIAIDGFEQIAGKLPRRALNLVIDWAELHRHELMEDWKLAQRGDALLPIDPLE